MTYVDVRSNPVRRARTDWQKEARSRAILDAAERLFAERDATMPTVEQVAREVGVAKGTVYLYFPTKEAIFLAVFRQRCLAWLEDVRARLQAWAGPLATEDLMSIFLAYPSEHRIVLDLARFAGPLLQNPLLADDSEAFKQDISERGRELCALLQRTNPNLSEERSATAMRQCYAYLVGLWQVTDFDFHPVGGPAPLPNGSAAKPGFLAMMKEFSEEARIGMSVLWRRCLS